MDDIVITIRNRTVYITGTTAVVCDGSTGCGPNKCCGACAKPRANEPKATNHKQDNRGSGEEQLPSNPSPPDSEPRESFEPDGKEPDFDGDRNLPVHQLDLVNNPIWKGRYFPDQLDE